MESKGSIIIAGEGLEEAVAEGFSHVTKSFVDDVICRSAHKDIIRRGFADFIGVYRTVKRSLKEAGIGADISYLEREALLDCYSANIAANEALGILSRNIPKTRDTRGFFRNSLDFRKYEKDASLREKLIIGELMTRYLEAAGSISERMIPELTADYFIWVMQQTARIKDSFAKSIDEAIKTNPIVMPSKRIYSGFSCREMKSGSQYAGKNTEKRSENRSGRSICGAHHPPIDEHDQKTEYPFLVRNLPNVRLDEVGGLEEQKEMIYDAIRLPIEHKSEFIEKGIEAPKGLIFYGPPGTGKTFLAKALANELNFPFFYLSGSEFRKKYLGDGPMIVRQLFSDARSLAPSLIFIDEVDACLRQRDSDEGKYSMDVVNQMLAEIDGFNPLDSVKVIVATNYYNLLDGTFCDRFPANYHLEFSMPCRDAREKALKAMTRKMKTRGIRMDSLAESTDGANFRALYFICNQAGMYSVKDHSQFIEQRHFNLALSAYIIDPTRYNNKKEG